jgi:hypothetical protein
MSDKSQRLLELARAAFPDLTDSERKVVEAAAAAGEAADFQSGDPQKDDPAKAETWGDDRKVRAAVLRWLCVDADARRLVDPCGVQVCGARIEGDLNLNFAKIPFPLGLFSSAVPGKILLRGARAATISLEGTHTGPIEADALTAEGSVFLRNRFHAKGLVRLLGARIRGVLDCTGGTFENPGGDALSADGVEVGGAVFMTGEFHAKGGVRFLGARIRGNLDCTGGVFEGAETETPDGKSIVALNADGLEVGGEVFLRGDFHAKGEVRLLGARIRGHLSCNGGTFENPGKKTLNADGLEVGKALFLSNGFNANGKVSLVHAKARVLIDVEAAWPAHGNLDLQGFVYEGIVGPTDARRRLRWLARQYPEKRRRGHYHPQPYEQLAAVLRRAGHVAESKKVLMEKERDLRKYGDLGPLAQAWNWFLGLTLGYGYRVRRALGWAAAIVLLGVLFFWLGHGAGLLSPTFPPRAEAAAPCEKRLDETFCPWVYSLDTFLPIVDLHQEGRWLPNRGGGDVATLFWPDRRVGITWGDVLCAWFWLEIGAGWLLTTLALAGLTGLIRRD